MNKKNQDYSFIKETIKQKDKKATRKKLAVAAACGIVFGLCAVFTFMLCMPWIINMAGEKGQMRETVQFSPPEEVSDQEKEAVQDTSQKRKNLTQIQQKSKPKMTVWPVFWSIIEPFRILRQNPERRLSV